MRQYERLSHDVGRVGLPPAAGRGSETEPRYEGRDKSLYCPIASLPHCPINEVQQ
jgi:hypothetical protein